jgi:hypothetical protein
LHIALLNGSRILEQTVGKRGFAVIDMSNNREIPDKRWIGWHQDTLLSTDCARIDKTLVHPNNYRTDSPFYHHVEGDIRFNKRESKKYIRDS